MVYNRVVPVSSLESNISKKNNEESSILYSQGDESLPTSSSKDFNDFDSINTLNTEESSYLKLRPFIRLDSTLVRLIKFLKFFGIFFNLQPTLVDIQDDSRANGDARIIPAGAANKRITKRTIFGARSLPMMMTLCVALVTAETVYDVNLRQSKLLAEQKRSTPLLTFVIVAYSWLTLVIPIICDISLVLISPHLFCFYSRTTSTVCNGE